MPKTFRIGDNVEWDSPQGKVRGKVKKQLISRTKVKGHEVAASEENPQYLVVSDGTGEEAAHKPEALDKIE